MIGFRSNQLTLLVFFVFLFVSGVPRIPALESDPLTPTENIESMNTAVIVDPAIQYAEYHDVDLDEAKRRIRLQEEARNVYRSIQTHPAFAGLWLEHSPDFKIVIQFTSDGWKILQEYPMSQELADSVETRITLASIHQLKDIQTATWAMVKDSGFEINHRVNIKTNRIELLVADSQQLLMFLSNVQETLSEYVDIVETNISVSETASINGGLRFNSTGTSSFSTSGFSVMSESTGELGVTTAGHSPNTKDYLGVNLPFVAEHDVDPYDVQWHLPANYTVRPWMYDGSGNRRVVDLRHYNDQMVGETVCKYGQVTGFDCGTIDDKTFMGQLILVVDDNNDLSEDNDSGGPFFVGNTAYGTIVGQLEPGNTAFYMAVNFVDILNLCVLHGPSNLSTPSLQGVLGNGVVQLTWSSPDDICGYALHRSTSPYFTPSTANLVGRYEKAVIGLNSTAGVGDISNNYTYLVETVTGSNDKISKRIGEFDFLIVPGT